MPLPNTFEKAKESGELVKSDYLFCMGMAILFWNFVPKQPLFMSFCYWLSFVLRFLFKVFFFFLGLSLSCLDDCEKLFPPRLF